MQSRHVARVWRAGGWGGWVGGRKRESVGVVERGRESEKDEEEESEASSGSCSSSCSSSVGVRASSLSSVTCMNDGG